MATKKSGYSKHTVKPHAKVVKCGTSRKVIVVKSHQRSNPK